MPFIDASLREWAFYLPVRFSGEEGYRMTAGGFRKDPAARVTGLLKEVFAK
jgi:hypothetical protein